MAKPVKRGEVYGIQIKVGDVRESATFPTMRECNDWQLQRRAVLKAEKSGRGGEVHSLGQALTRYAEEVAPTHKSERQERISIARMSRDLPVRLALSSVKPEHILNWRNERLTQIKPSSVAREMNVLASVFNAAIREWRWIKTSPMSEVRRPKQPRHRERVISRAEVKTMLRSLGWRAHGRPQTFKQITAAVFVMALRTGMRSSEITDLTWDRVHDSWVRLSETKNDTSRDVPLSKAARRLIERMRGLDDTLVFPVAAQSRDAIFRTARNQAGLSGFTFHDARHTAATRIGATVGQPGRLSFPEFCRVFGWRDPKFALVYVNPSAASLAAKL